MAICVCLSSTFCSLGALAFIYIYIYNMYHLYSLFILSHPLQNHPNTCCCFLLLLVFFYSYTSHSTTPWCQLQWPCWRSSSAAQDSCSRTARRRRMEWGYWRWSSSRIRKKFMLVTCCKGDILCFSSNFGIHAQKVYFHQVSWFYSSLGMRKIHSQLQDIHI